MIKINHLRKIIDIIKILFQKCKTYKHKNLLKNKKGIKLILKLKGIRIFIFIGKTLKNYHK